MSLAVWLPLNGDLHNQGLLPVTITEYGDMTISNSGKIGKCYTFDGKDDYLSLAGLNFSGLSEFSFSFWCKPLKNSLYGIFQIKSGGTVALQFATATSFTFRDSKHSSLTGVSFNTPVAGEWAHYTFVYNKGSWLVYKNGIQDGSGFTAIQEATFYQSSTTFFIGCRKVSSKNSYFSGDLNDFRIYNHALSKKEVEEISKGLILHYPLNQLYDNNIIYDTSGYCNNGEIIGNITTITPSPRYNYATKLNSTKIDQGSTRSGAAYIVGDISLTEPSQISISWWINGQESYNSSTGQFNNGVWSTSMTDASDYSASAFNHRDNTFDINSSDGVKKRLTANISTNNQWSYYALVYNGQVATLYKNGNIKQTISFDEPKTLGSFIKIFIGFSKAGGVYRKVVATYSDFRIYCTALSANQVKELYNTSMQIDSSGNVFARELVEL